MADRSDSISLALESEAQERHEDTARENKLGIFEKPPETQNLTIVPQHFQKVSARTCTLQHSFITNTGTKGAARCQAAWSLAVGSRPTRSASHTSKSTSPGKARWRCRDQSSWRSPRREEHRRHPGCKWGPARAGTYHHQRLCKAKCSTRQLSQCSRKEDAGGAHPAKSRTWVESTTLVRCHLPISVSSSPHSSARSGALSSSPLDRAWAKARDREHHIRCGMPPPHRHKGKGRESKSSMTVPLLNVIECSLGDALLRQVSVPQTSIRPLMLQLHYNKGTGK